MSLIDRVNEGGEERSSYLLPIIVAIFLLRLSDRQGCLQLLLLHSRSMNACLYSSNRSILLSRSADSSFFSLQLTFHSSLLIIAN